MLQVELNTIAASFGSLSTLVSQLHAYLIPRYPKSTPATLGQLPPQDALNGFAKGLYQAHQAFCTHHKLRSEDAGIVMVVQPGERNAFDQRWLQLKVRFCTLFR
jgi:glutathione synthase